MEGGQQCRACGIVGVGAAFLLRGSDPDDVFAYQTPKVVRVRDRYLGLMNLTFKLGILLYVALFAILYGKQVVRCYSPHMTAAVNLEYIPTVSDAECENATGVKRGFGTAHDVSLNFLSVAGGQGYCAADYSTSCCGLLPGQMSMSCHYWPVSRVDAGGGLNFAKIALSQKTHTAYSSGAPSPSPTTSYAIVQGVEGVHLDLVLQAKSPAYSQILMVDLLKKPFWARALVRPGSHAGTRPLGRWLSACSRCLCTCPRTRRRTTYYCRGT